MWLGHSSISTTMDLYLHFLEKRIKESAKILENIMKKGTKERFENNKKITYINNLISLQAKI